MRHFQGYKDQALPVRPEILLVDRIFRPSEELVIAVACPVIFGFTDFMSSLLDLRLLLDFVFLSFRRLRSRGQPCKPTTARVLTTNLEIMEFQGHPFGFYPVTGQLEHNDGPHEEELDSTGVPLVPGGIDGDLVEPSTTLEREVAVAPRGRQYSPHEWEKMKPTIRKHFIEDGKTYQEVLNSLAPQFTPTLRTLKNKLKQWCYTKNNRLGDLRAMVGMQRERRKYGKKTVFFKTESRLLSTDC